MPRTSPKKQTRKSRAPSSRGATKVTSIYPNGAQELKFQVARPTSPTITQVADSPFKRRSGRKAAPSSTVLDSSRSDVHDNAVVEACDVAKPSVPVQPNALHSGKHRGAGAGTDLTQSLPVNKHSFQSLPNIARLDHVTAAPLPKLSTLQPMLPTPSEVKSHATRPAPTVARIEEEFEHFNLEDVSEGEDDLRTANAAGATTAAHSIIPDSMPRNLTTSIAQPPGKRASRKVANDVHLFLQQSNDDANCRHCVLCLHMKKSTASHHVAVFRDGTSTSSIRRHLYEVHLTDWVTICDRFKIPITAKSAMSRVEEYRLAQAARVPANGDLSSSEGASPRRHEFSHEAFIKAIVEWIVADDQSLRVIESKELRAIFLMLRNELRDTDIPSRSTIKRRIEQVFEQHLEWLESEMSCALGKISFTMDMWSDPNMSPFMAVTAHWIKGETVKTVSAEFVSLALCCELIGFVNVPDRHTGEHLAYAFLNVLERIHIAPRVGWITLDNASSNDTFAAVMERELTARGISFDYRKRRIRCFPHIVNLACKAVLAKMTVTEYAKTAAGENVPRGVRAVRSNSAQELGVLNTIQRDPIDTLRSLIKIIRASSLRRQGFSRAREDLNLKALELLRDVETRWSSTFLMIDRALILRDAISRFLDRDEFTDLRRFTIHQNEWTALELFRNVLKVPNAFQHILAKEKTPTLGSALPAYERMKQTWEKMQKENPETERLIEPGLDKLAEYRILADANPTYILATLINPRLKLRWFEENAPHEVRRAKKIILSELAQYDHRSGGHSVGVGSNHRSKVDSPVASNGANLEDPEEILGLRTVTSLFRTREEELEAYLQEGLEACDLLRYWERKKEKFPTLYRLAMDILPIQASASGNGKLAMWKYIDNIVSIAL